ncbi:MAG: AAA family ATPase [Xanthomonadales bacterium]|uniref:AAA family ATPase n=1 Tax=Accumulibacter sp. TaxID=2053492 RepID=UPI001AC6451B|nr:AAA family ATPase [Accumulibacter sp.]MBN8213917.1 AAA family ATPase [Xanthomonadales bacterium]MBO3703068.1 AAA family ATPase [Accumulibacter sp.]
MAIVFVVLSLGGRVDTAAKNLVQLLPNNWDDYSYKTLFGLHYVNASGDYIALGSVKIGYKGQSNGWTKDTIPAQFSQLPESWFSVGQDVEYYEKALSLLSPEERALILGGMRDVAFDDAALSVALNEDVFETSLLRGVSALTVHGQYRRVLRGEAVLTDFKFAYQDSGGKNRSAVDLTFQVVAGSKPPTNVHVLIGRNGIGKTTILNGMVQAVHTEYGSERTGQFLSHDSMFSPEQLPDTYFSSVVSVSFSVFDPFVPPPDSAEPKRGPKYFYIGMKKARLGDGSDAEGSLKSEPDLIEDFVRGFGMCMSQEAKRMRWLKAIDRLASDGNFAAMNLSSLADSAQNSFENTPEKARKLLALMSSGHKIVLLTITALVNLVEEKTLVLMDEPESHLHPPLLSAFTRALSELLHDRNGVAIVATHSPVVVQEVPRSCVWKLNRSGLEWRKDRPERETFGENVGLLTKEVFGLEVSKSGFHAMLQEEVEKGGTFDEVVAAFRQKIGMEGLAILMSMIAARDAEEARMGGAS